MICLVTLFLNVINVKLIVRIFKEKKTILQLGGKSVILDLTGISKVEIRQIKGVKKKSGKF